MGQLKIGPKHRISGVFQERTDIEEDVVPIDEEKESLKSQIIDLEASLQKRAKLSVIETVREVKTVEIVEKPIEVIKYIEKIIEVPVEKIIEVIKEVNVVEYKIVEKPTEVIEQVEKLVKVIPKWVFGIVTVETLLLIYLLVK